MKKYSFIIYILVMVALLLPTNAYGKSYIEFDCDSSKLNIGESTTCNIIANADYDIGSYEFELSKSNGIDTKDFKASDGWVSDSGETKYGAINASGVKSGSIVGTIVFVNNGQATNTKNIEVKNIQLGLINNNGNIETVEPDNMVIDVAIEKGAASSNIITTLLPIGIAVVIVIGIVIAFASKKKRK